MFENLARKGPGMFLSGDCKYTRTYLVTVKTTPKAIAFVSSPIKAIVQCCTMLSCSKLEKGYKDEENEGHKYTNSTQQQAGACELRARMCYLTGSVGLEFVCSLQTHYYLIRYPTPSLVPMIPQVRPARHFKFPWCFP